MFVDIKHSSNKKLKFNKDKNEQASDSELKGKIVVICIINI